MSTKDIVFIALMGALLSACKFVLSFIPNVEVVTLIIVTSSLVFGVKKTFLACIIFCTIEGLLYGFNPNILCYYIHWPCLSLGCLLFKNRRNKEALGVLYVLIATALFGVQSSFVAVVISGGASFSFSKFLTMYLSGITFYIIHIISNFIIFLVLFSSLSKAFDRIKNSYYK